MQTSEVYATHAPCVSCLAAAAQCRAAWPAAVRLELSFDSWAASRRDPAPPPDRQTYEQG